MKKDEILERVKKITQNRTYQFLFALLIGGGVAWGMYTYLVNPMFEQRKGLEERITKTDPAVLRSKIRELKEEKKTQIAAYKKVQAEFETLEGKIYKTHYPIIIDILDKINAYAFNIHHYELDEASKKMKVTLVGSYQNLIRLIDFLGTIPANVTVSGYKVSLSEKHMLSIDLDIEVAPVRI